MSQFEEQTLDDAVAEAKAELANIRDRKYGVMRALERSIGRCQMYKRYARTDARKVDRRDWERSAVNASDAEIALRQCFASEATIINALRANGIRGVF